jgi:hypothetical protein
MAEQSKEDDMELKPIPERDGYDARAEDVRFLLLANPYGVHVLIPSPDPAGDVDLIRLYLRSVATNMALSDDPGDEYIIKHLLRLASGEITMMSDSSGYSFEDEWADIVGIPGYGVPADILTAPYACVVRDIGDGEHVWRPVCFVREEHSKAVMMTDITSALISVLVLELPTAELA